MTISKLSVFILITLFFFSATLEAQKKKKKKEEDYLSLKEGTIKERIDFIIDKSNRYQNFKVIKRSWLYKLKGQIADSLNVVHRDLAETQIVVGTQKKEIEALKTDLEKTHESLAAVEKEKDSIALFGVQMAKPTYKAIMWTIIAALLALWLVFVFRFKQSNTITLETKKALLDTQEEFAMHKKRALEKEQKLMRELQDELNKHL